MNKSLPNLDESISIFKELQEKAFNSVAEALPVKNNNVDFVIGLPKDPLNQGVYFVKVTINGEEFSTYISGRRKETEVIADEILEWFSGLFYKDFVDQIYISKAINQET